MQRPALTKLPVETSRAVQARGNSTLILVAILLLGLCSRTVAIGRESLWSDEALTLVIAHWPLWTMVTDPTDPTGPFYYTLHKLLFPDSVGVIAARSISLVAGMASLVAVHAIGRFAFSRDGALLATALAAVSAPLIDYSQEARAYSVLILLCLTSAAALLWWFDENRREARPQRYAALALFVMATTLALYTHLVAIFWIGPALIILLFLSRRFAQSARDEAVLGIAAVTVLLTPELVRLVKASQIDVGFTWLAQASPASFAATVRDALLPSGFGRAGDGFVVIAALAMIGWALVRRWQLLREWSAVQRPAAAVIAVLLLFPLAVWLFGFVAQPIFMTRTMLPGVIGFFLFISLLVDLQSPRAGLAVGAAAILAYVGALLVNGTVRHKEPWRAANSELAQHVRPGDLIVVCPYWKFPALRHAAFRPVAAPVISVNRVNPVLLEPRLGTSDHWPANYFATMSDPEIQLAPSGSIRVALARRALSLGLRRTIWLVASECSKERTQTIRRSLGTGKWSRAWSSEIEPAYAPITLLRFDPAGG